MAYCGSTDLLNRWGFGFLKQTSDLNNSYSTIQWAVVNDARLEADAYIDGRLALTKYASDVPFTTIPQQVTQLSARLTGYYLALGARRKSPEILMVKKYVDEVLDQIEEGRLGLTTSGTALSVSGQELASTTSGYLPTFRRRWTNLDGGVESHGTMEDA